MICTSGPVLVRNPHVVTTVLDGNGKLLPDAKVTISAEVYNASEVRQIGVLTYNFAGLTRSSPTVTLLPKQKQTVTFSALTVTNARLWWPNGYGAQELFTLDLSFATSLRDFSPICGDGMRGSSFGNHKTRGRDCAGNCMTGTWTRRAASTERRAPVRWSTFN
jgi:hypothetical protein